jgi:hypothetical protein
MLDRSLGDGGDNEENQVKLLHSSEALWMGCCQFSLCLSLCLSVCLVCLSNSSKAFMFYVNGLFMFSLCLPVCLSTVWGQKSVRICFFRNKRQTHLNRSKAVYWSLSWNLPAKSLLFIIFNLSRCCKRLFSVVKS